MTQRIETSRLVLRRFDERDDDALFDLDADPEVMRYLTGGPGTPREVVRESILPRFREIDPDRPGLGFWAVEERDGGRFVGWVGLRAFEPGAAEVNLGFRFRREAWGRGYATEAAGELVRRAFDEWGMSRVVATVYEDNAGSRRVLEKLGLRLVRRFRMSPADLAAVDTCAIDPESVWDGDDLEYALDREDAGRPA